MGEPLCGAAWVVIVMTVQTGPKASSTNEPTWVESSLAVRWTVGSLVALPFVWGIAFFVGISLTQEDKRDLPSPWGLPLDLLALAVFLAPAVIAAGTGVAMWQREDRRRAATWWWLLPVLLGAAAAVVVSLVVGGLWWLVLGATVAVTAGFAAAVHRAPQTTFHWTWIALCVLVVVSIGYVIGTHSLWVTKS